MILSAALLAMAPPIPAIECVDKDGGGRCVLDYSKKPVRRIHDLHAQRAAEIYHPYFVCYYENLISDERFGTDDRVKATAAMNSARATCARKRVAAEKEIDCYLKGRKIYGDAADRRFVRERFRREAGSIFVYTTARANGRGAEFERMANAMSERQAIPND